MILAAISLSPIGALTILFKLLILCIIAYAVYIVVIKWVGDQTIRTLIGLVFLVVILIVVAQILGVPIG